MKIFNELTVFIDKFYNIEYGRWIIDNKNDGSQEHPMQIPYTRYADSVYDFIDAVYTFQSNHPELNLTHYEEILKNQSIEWNKDSMAGAIVDDLDAETVLALLIGILRADKYCEGVLLSMLENGTIQRCLMRLKELDKN